MASAALPEEEQNGCTGLGDLLPTSDKVSSELGVPRIKEQSSSGDDFTPKVRKPYTITKQRERWTDEEHKKFTEALKLYGRAWRKIEEHVGSKTAVQIRSHAQKFFSKVVRESNDGDANSVMAIEIPPPRPKRKPMHPYPRKFVASVKTGIKIPEKQTSSASLNASEQDNQSPTSVLSAMGSDSSVDPYSCMPNGSPSSGSSALAFNAGSACGSEVPKLPSEGVISLWPNHEGENSSLNDEIPLELEPSLHNSVFIKEKPIEAAAQSFKLFGKTLLITNVHGSSSSGGETFKPESSYKHEDSWLLPPSNICCPVPLSCMFLSSNVLHRSMEVHSLTPVKAQPTSDKKEETESKQPVKGRGESSHASNKLSSRPLTNCGKGFVPYKRCFSEHNPALSKNSEEREQQRIRLC